MIKDEYVVLTHTQWISAATQAGFDAYDDSSDDLEEDWGLMYMRAEDLHMDTFRFLITDKQKWFLAKIKYGI